MILLGCMLILMSIEARGQQEPMFTQYMFNTVAVNPAYAGTRNTLNLTSLSRLQWLGLEGSPKTYSVALHTPINKKKIGVGFTVVDDEIGPVSNTYFTGNYAYRLKLNEKLTLSMGIKGGLSYYYVGLTDLSLTDEMDPEFMQNEKKLDPNVGVGFYLYSDNFYVGLSAPKLFESSVDEEQMLQGNEIKRHYYLIGGYVMDLNSKWKFKPTLLTKVVEGAPPSNDVSLQFLYVERLWLSAMYRIGDAAGLFVDYRITDQLTVGYGYDFQLNGLSGRNSGTHEILISFDFDNFFGNNVKSPRFF